MAKQINDDLQTALQELRREDSELKPENDDTEGQEVVLESPIRRVRVDFPSGKMRTFPSYLSQNALRDTYAMNLKELFTRDPGIKISQGLVLIVAGQGHGKTTLLNIIKEQFQNRLHLIDELPLKPTESGTDGYAYIKAFESDYVDMNPVDLVKLLLKEEEQDVLTTKFPRMTIKGSIEALNAAILHPDIRVILFDGLRFLNSEAKGTPAIKEGVLRGVFDDLTSLSSFISAHNKLVIATLGTDTSFEVTNELYFERGMATVPVVMRPFIHEGYMKVMVTARTSEERKPTTYTLARKGAFSNASMAVQEAASELLKQEDFESTRLRDTVSTEERLSNLWSSEINI